MPTYEFYNTKTEEVEDHFMSYTKLDEFKKDNPHLQQRVSAPNIVGSVSVKNKKVVSEKFLIRWLKGTRVLV